MNRLLKTHLPGLNPLNDGFKLLHRFFKAGLRSVSWLWGFVHEVNSLRNHATPRETLPDRSTPAFDPPTDIPYALPMSKTATIETTRGTIHLDLFDEQAPDTVGNFEKLAKDGFYDGLKFHRVISDFMIQTGCPQGSGTGGPGYKFDDEASALKLKHDKAGILSMANAGPNTNGSQFFITHGPTPHLNGKHAVFGTVTKGQDVVDSIKQGDTMEKVTVSDD